LSKTLLSAQLTARAPAVIIALSVSLSFNNAGNDDPAVVTLGPRGQGAAAHRRRRAAWPNSTGRRQRKFRSSGEQGRAGG
jgi:hypothetical protein